MADFESLYPSPYPFPFPARRPQPAGPAVLPADESSLLGNLMEGSLGGLAYVGKILDKTFGGRAVRGLLGGRPDELLSVLPMSDTLGLTDEKNAVQGTDLLEQAGLLTPGDHSLENQVAGFGAEVLTDPATLFGAAVPKAVFRGLGGGARLAGAGLQAATGVNPVSYAARQARRVTAPFEPAANALFDTSVHGTWTPQVQQLARDVYDPLLTQGKLAAGQAVAGPLVDLGPTARQIGDRPLLDALQLHVEGYTPEATSRLTAAGVDPAQVPKILSLVDGLAGDVRGTRAAERAVGSNTPDLLDLPEWQQLANAHAQAQGAAPAFASGPYFPRGLAPGDAGLPAPNGVSSRLSATSGFQAQREDLLRGVPNGSVGVNDLVRDPRLTGADRALQPLQVQDELLRTLTGFGSGPVPPAWAHGPEAWAAAHKQAEGLAQYLGNLPSKLRDTGLYSSDVLGQGLNRLVDSARMTATGKTVVEGIGRFAVPAADLDRAGRAYVRVPDLLEKFGLTARDVHGAPTAQELAARRLGLPTNGPADLAALKDLAVPADVAQDMARMGQAWKTPAVLKPVVDAYDGVANFFKTSLTSVFPAFHARNVMSGLFNAWRDGALSTPGVTNALAVLRGGALDAATAAKLYPGLAPVDATTQLLKDVIGSKVAFSRDSRQVADLGGIAARPGGAIPSLAPGAAAAPRPVGQDLYDFAAGLVPPKGQVGEALNPMRQAGVLGEADQFVPVKAGRQVGNVAEDFNRLQHYISARLGGAGPADAAERVTKYHFDYGDLTSFEREAMKRIFPWYTFSRKSLPPLLEDLAARPAKVAGATRLMSGVRQPGEFVPPYLAEGASVPVPGAPDDQQRYISSFGLPMEDELVKTIGSAMQGDYPRVAQQLFGMAQPFLKVGPELATGTQMFSGRKLEDLRPYEFTTLGGLVPENTARQASQLIANTPLSRVGSTLDKLTDERKGGLPAALNTLTGVRVTDVDTNQVRERAAQKLLQDLLRGQPGVKSREEVYVPKDQIPRLSPDDLLRYDLLKEVEARAAARGRERAKAAGR